VVDTNKDDSAATSSLKVAQHEDDGSSIRGQISRNGSKALLMLSEPLQVLPDDLKSSWLAVPCPVARRCIVYANGRTCRY
jgi:hypothetical protein